MHISDFDLPQRQQCRNALNTEQSNSLAQSNRWEHVDRATVHADWDAFYTEFSKWIDISNPADRNIQELMARHYEISCRFYPPSRDAYIGMALFYHENPDMNAFHNAYHPKMVEFLGDAMYTYAQEKLSAPVN